MTNKLNYLFSIFILSSALAGTANSQSFLADAPLRAGIYADVGLNLIDAGFRGLPAIPTCCSLFDSGSGYGFSLGLNADYGIFADFRAELRATYHYSANKISKTENIILSVDNQPYPGQFEHRIDANFHSIDLMPTINYKLYENTSISGGFLFRFTTSNNFEQEEEIIKPSDRGVFPETGTQFRNFRSGEIANTNSLQSFLTLAVKHSLPLNAKGNLILVPELGFDYALSDIINDVNWKNHRLRLGVSVMYDNSPKMIIDTVPTPAIVQIPIIAPNDFKIDIMGIDDNQSEKPVMVVHTEEYLFFNLKPLLSYVFFEHNADTLLNRYKLLTTDETDKFDIAEISHQETLDIYHHLLNIVGKRLRIRSNSTITLTGCNSNLDEERGNKDLSLRRAETVKEYLTKVWQIAPERINILVRNRPLQASNSDHNDGIEENRRVEIYSDDWEIIKPIIIDDTTRRVNPHVLRFNTSAFTAATDLKWDLRVNFQGKEVANFAGEGTPQPSIDFPINNLFDKSLKTSDSLVYKFTVRQLNSGKELEYAGALPIDNLTIERAITEKQKNVKYEKFSLILFPFDKFSLSKENQWIADIINSRIKSNSKIKVVAYTDRTGSDEHNFKLSTNRAKATAGIITGDGIPYEGMGESILIFDNNIPEGRFYCRTVEVHVETEINEGTK